MKLFQGMPRLCCRSISCCEMKCSGDGDGSGSAVSDLSYYSSVRSKFGVDILLLENLRW